MPRESGILLPNHRTPWLWSRAGPKCGSRAGSTWTWSCTTAPLLQPLPAVRRWAWHPSNDWPWRDFQTRRDLTLTQANYPPEDAGRFIQRNLDYTVVTRDDQGRQDSRTSPFGQFSCGDCWNPRYPLPACLRCPMQVRDVALEDPRRGHVQGSSTRRVAL